MFSPDGRWLAYASDEWGRYEVYVQPFPSLIGKWQISTEGGREPVWERSARELFYRNGVQDDGGRCYDAIRFSRGQAQNALRGTLLWLIRAVKETTTSHRTA